METRDDLLQPTLGHGASPATSIYSARTGYVTAFIGGPIAGAAVALLNAHRLKRLRIDWPLGVVAVVLTVGPIWWWMRGGGESWVVAHLGRGMERVGLRAIGLGFFALVYARHRQYYRNMALFGLEPPSGWGVGTAAVIVGVVVSVFTETALS
jgi:hypothetical protein